MNLRIASAMLAVALMSGVAVANSDNFDNNAKDAQWLPYPGSATPWLQDIANLNLVEQNQRVEVISTGSAGATDDALYLSDGPNGYALSTAADFEIQIDLTVTFATLVGNAGDTFAFQFGVGTDEAGDNAAAIGWGFAVLSGNFVQSSLFHVTDTGGTRTGPTPIAAVGIPSTFTFEIAYDATNDQLHLGLDGQPPVATYPGLVEGTWNADALLFSFGARGNGLAFASGDAFFDNFQIVTGQLVPEPASIALIGLGGIALLARRR